MANVRQTRLILWAWNPLGPFETDTCPVRSSELSPAVAPEPGGCYISLKSA